MKTSYWVFMALSLLSLGLGFKNFSDEKAIFAKYVLVTATLTDWQPDLAGKNGNMCPVFSFQSREGGTRTYMSDQCADVPDPSTVGKVQQQVYYDPANPYAEVQTSGWSGRQGIGLIIGLACFVFFSLMWLIPLLSNRFNRQASPVKQRR